MAEAPITLPAHGTSLLPRAISELIFEDARKASVVQRLARRIPLPYAGVAIPYMTGKPVASWVAEGGRKPISDASVGTKTMDPKKLSVIVPFSIEYLRSDTVDLLETLRPDIAEAFGEAFDAAAISGTSTPFANHLIETTNFELLGAGTSMYVDAVNLAKEIAADGYSLNGWAVGEQGQWVLAGDVDTEGRPILTTVTDAESGITRGTLLGRRAEVGEQVDVASAAASGVGDGNDVLVAIGGDWSKAAWGAVGEIEYDVNDSATLTKTDDSVINLWQENLVALRAEAWYGFAIRDVEAFGELVTAGEAV
jgi:HK97 family phage major capsid protein